MTPWRREDFRMASGPALRPGGLVLTLRGLELCRRYCGLSRGARALDMGCGDGATLDLLEKQGYRALGLDLEPGRLRAEAYSARVGIRAEAERTPLADAVMDAVLCECVLSLLAEPSRALGECARIVRPGGALLLTDVYARNEDDGFCPTGERRLAEWSHLLAEAGFFLHVFEDHSQALAELAAKLAWYGEADLTAFFGLSGDARRSHRGYGLWIAQKEMPCTR